MSRIAAWNVLRSGTPSPLRAVDEAAARRGLDERDRGLLRRLLGAEVRHRGSLRALVRAFADRKPKPELAAHLHLGMAQILWFDRVPDHAAVSETLRAVRETLGPPKVRVVNGLLRTLLRERREGRSGDPRHDLVDRELSIARPVFRDQAEHPLLWAEDALSIPSHLFKRWVRRHGEARARALGELFLAESPLVVRGVGCSPEEARALLAEMDVEARPGVHPRVLVCASEATGAVVRSEAFAAGRLSIQGESALAAAELVEAREGERLLDLCAAPGGKTAVLLEAGAEVTAVDVDPTRLALVGEGARRLGLDARLASIASDGTRDLPPGEYDGVLVDAPCSNTGVLGARPAARWRFGPASLRSLGGLQERLLAEAAERVRPGGRLVWSTCSLEPEENGQRVRAFLRERPGWELEDEREALPAAPPVPGPVDGGYAARLRREA